MTYSIHTLQTPTAEGFPCLTKAKYIHKQSHAHCLFMNEIKAQTDTHTRLGTLTECKGNPAIRHLHSKHPLLFGADTVTTLNLLLSPFTDCDTHTLFALTPLTPSWGVGGGGIATAHFASMQPPSERSWDAQEEEGAREGGDPKHIGEDQGDARGRQNKSEGQRNAPPSSGSQRDLLVQGGCPHAFPLVPAAWQRAESRVKACRLLYIHTG